MESKKNIGAEIYHLKANFFLIGMIFSLLVTLAAFSYTKYERKESKQMNTVYEEKVEVMENTEQKKPPPPPPPPPTLEIVEDNVEIPDDQPEIEDSEDDQEKKVEPPAPVEKNDEPEETNEVLEYFDVSKMAEFKGGDEARMRFIRENLHYPEMAIANELEGKITVQFVVWKDGSIRNIEILGPKKGYEILEKEAIRVIEKMGEQRLWIPAEQRDKKVPVRFRLPIEFQL
jgi:protein TonB